MKQKACTFYASLLTDDMICGGNEQDGKDACSGDSGGPLACIQNNTMILAGITTYGLGCAWELSNGERIPGIYMRITSYLDWINLVLDRTKIFTEPPNRTEPAFFFPLYTAQPRPTICPTTLRERTNKTVLD